MMQDARPQLDMFSAQGVTNRLSASFPARERWGLYARKWEIDANRSAKVRFLQVKVSRWRFRCWQRCGFYGGKTRFVRFGQRNWQRDHLGTSHWSLACLGTEQKWGNYAIAPREVMIYHAGRGGPGLNVVF